MKFFIILGNNALYTYEQKEQQFEPQFIEGSNAFTINAGNVCEDIASYLQILANEKNLGTIAKLEFDVLESSITNYNTEIMAALAGHINKTYPLENTLKIVIKKLLRDKKLMIDLYGINYEGHSYKVKNNRIIQEEYDLLGYTVHGNDIVELMDV